MHYPKKGREKGKGRGKGKRKGKEEGKGKSIGRGKEKITVIHRKVPKNTKLWWSQGFQGSTQRLPGSHTQTLLFITAVTAAAQPQLRGDGRNGSEGLPWTRMFCRKVWQGTSKPYFGDFGTATQQTISVSITKIPLSRDGAQADILAASWSQAKHFQTMLCEWAGPPAWAAGTISTWSKKFSHWKLDKWNHRDSKSSSKLTPKLYKIPFIAAHSADAEPREASSFISEPRSNPMALLHKHWDIYPAAGKSGLTFF